MERLKTYQSVVQTRLGREMLTLFLKMVDIQGSLILLQSQHIRQLQSKQRFQTDYAMNEAWRIKSGGYNVFRDCNIDGNIYKTAAINMNNTDTLTIHNNLFETEQLEAQREVELQGLALQAILRATPDGVQLLDKSDTVLAVNDSDIRGSGHPLVRRDAMPPRP